MEATQPDNPDDLRLRLVEGTYRGKPAWGQSDDVTRALLLRVDPGTVIPPHRHTREVHALNLAGSRELLGTGQIVGRGGYVYEPPGNGDSWRAVGDVPVVVFVTVRGAIEHLDDRGEVTRRSTTPSITESYRAFTAQPARQLGA